MRSEYKSYWRVLGWTLVVGLSFTPYFVLCPTDGMSALQTALDSVFAHVFRFAILLTVLFSAYSVYSHNAGVDEDRVFAEKEEARKKEEELLNALEDL